MFSAGMMGVAGVAVVTILMFLIDGGRSVAERVHELRGEVR